MKKAKLKINAKINLTLEVLGVTNGYHDLSSVVASVNLADVITIYKRKDDLITLTERGIKAGCPPTQNNACITAEKVMKTFGVSGVDIVINKGIPVGAGLGGSSADIAGVLKCMQQLFGVNAVTLGNEIGSDTAYMINGGYALMQGRGQKITPIKFTEKLYLVMLFSDNGVNTGKCFALYDQNPTIENSGASEKTVEAMQNGETETAISCFSNDLTLSAQKLNQDIKKNLELLKTTTAKSVLMTGAGSCVYAVFTDKRERNREYKKLLKTGVEKRFIKKAQTIV
ncbi:MAG: 4-(cytidine 5'-diphospho)-2-C-methyl-D-erythritol kinase [Clostridia bacterium]|nr:4-(cytidine 5'-diphospho)-2-C-methyl-D-erythritol kinase [Clostridia bacterium]